MEESPYRQFRGDRHRAFQTDDLDACDSAFDDVPSARAVLMATLSSYDSDVLLEETLELAEESKLKMLAKQNDPSLKEKKVNIAHVDYVALNKLSEHFVKHFVPQKQLSADMYFGYLFVKPPVPSKPVLKKEIPRKLPSINKKYFEIEKRELSLDNDRLLEHVICQEVKNTVMNANDHSDNVLPENNNSLKNDNYALELPSHNQDALEFKKFFIINELQSQLKAKNVSIEKLKEHIANVKGKNVVESVQNVHNSNVVTLKVYKLDLQPPSPPVKHNRDAHVNYLKHTQENDDILREIVEHARELRPLDSDLASACTFVTQIQELLVYVSSTCPSTRPVSDKLVVVTPMKRTRTVSSIKASRSKPRSNRKKDKITQTSNNKKTNKVEDQPRNAKSSLNNLNRVSKTVLNANNKHSVLNANSKIISATFHECMFDVIHDLCVHNYLNDVNARVKSKFLISRHAKSKKKKIWKHTSKVYTNVGYSEDLGKLKLKADIAIFVGYASAKKAYRFYNKRTKQIMETIHVTFDELTTMASEQFSSGPAPQLMTLGTLIHGAVARRPADLTGSPVSTSLEQDSPCASTSSTQEQEHSPIISQGVEESPKAPHFHDDTLHETLHVDSTSQGSSSNVQPSHTPLDILGKWTKNHPLANVIGDPS
ncbi:hypothetical protein Tco_0321720 [Tanacetum coccineum]